jgi:hypothetical protein
MQIFVDPNRSISGSTTPRATLLFDELGSKTNIPSQVTEPFSSDFDFRLA